MSELEMPGLPWFNVDEGSQRHREMGKLKCICHLRPTHPDWESSKDRALTMSEIHFQGEPCELSSL